MALNHVTSDISWSIVDPNVISGGGVSKTNKIEIPTCGVGSGGRVSTTEESTVLVGSSDVSVEVGLGTRRNPFWESSKDDLSFNDRSGGSVQSVQERNIVAVSIISSKSNSVGSNSEGGSEIRRGEADGISAGDSIDNDVKIVEFYGGVVSSPENKLRCWVINDGNTCVVSFGGGDVGPNLSDWVNHLTKVEGSAFVSTAVDFGFKRNAFSTDVGGVKTPCDREWSGVGPSSSVEVGSIVGGAAGGRTTKAPDVSSSWISGTGMIIDWGWVVGFLGDVDDHSSGEIDLDEFDNW